MEDQWAGRLARLEEEFAAARARWEEERAALQAEIHQLLGEVARLESENNRLREKLSATERTTARQAAPFRRPPERKVPEAQRKKPGRKPGHPGASRQIPPHLDEEVEMPLAGCPHCGGTVEGVQALTQYIEEIPPLRPVVTKLTTYVGKCRQCGEVRSTHPLQTSTAGGAARVQLGPRALAWAVELNKRLGVSMRNTCSIFQRLAGLRLTPGGLAQALDRVAARCRRDYQNLLDQIRESPVVYADETSWWVGESGWWLWTFTTPQQTLYRVEQSRGKGIVAKTLGPAFGSPAFGGCLVSDCGSMYNAIDCRKQKCFAHHLKAIREARELQASRLHVYLDACQEFLGRVIALWKERGKIPPEEFAARRDRLQQQCDELLARELRWPGDQKVRNRLANHRQHLLTCLTDERIEPTNNRAERALRPAVIARKISCGNRTMLGKQTWEILTSLAVTCHQRGESLLDYLAPRLTLVPA